jgi:hypothetical protein
MWTIRKEQLESLQSHALGNFTERMTAWLREQFPDRLPADGAAQSRTVTGWIADARQWGVTRENNVQTYLGLCAAYPALRAQPAAAWLVDLMTYPDRDEDLKLELLQDELFFGSPNP